MLYHAEVNTLPEIEGCKWSQNDNEIKSLLNAINSANKNFISEIKSAGHSGKELLGKTFPLPCLLLLYKSSKEQIKDWKEMHEHVLNNNYNNRIIELDGPHYLHHKFPFEISNYIIDFLNQDNN